VYLIDFVVAGRFAIEVNGNYAHRNRHEADQRRVAALERCGYRVLTLTEDEITTGQAIHLIHTHLSQS
jgi:very-short-patch-repair endonuclease